MFKNAHLAEMFRLQEQIDAINCLMDEAYEAYDMDTTSHYMPIIASLEEELVMMKRNHKSSLANDYELVYTC